jgi:predicted acylesterase/phospholipase RssA
MPRLGLALSGGGFRATLFHLGVVRFLRDSGALRDVTDIAAVSGGSILAAHLVLNWDQYNGDEQRFAEAAAQIVEFVRFDVRNHIVRRLPLLYSLSFLARRIPGRGRGLTANAVLERYYARFLYGDRCLYELPERPTLHILATNVSNGGLSVFNRNGLFIQQRADVGGPGFERVSGQLASIARVVGASSAFPGFFPPVAIRAADLGVREGQFPTEWFTDGGVYDNLGMRAFSWLKQQDAEIDQILVSDAGKPFQVLSDAALGLIGQSLRATDILWDRVGQLERENFASQPGFLFIPITATVDPQSDPTALHPVVQAEVQSVRTDMDRFTPTEINALAMHGYEVARKVYRDHFATARGPVADTPPWAPLPEAGASRGHNPGRTASTAPATLTARTLRGSSRRKVWSTLLSVRDWPTFLYIALAGLVFLYLPYQVYQLYRRAQVQATVIDSIASGDPDIRQVLGLLSADPTTNWVPDKVVEKAEPAKTDYSAFEMLTRSRFIDLRRWREAEASPERRGDAFVREHLTIKMLKTSKDSRRIILRYPIRSRDLQIRVTNSTIPRTIWHVGTPFDYHGEPRNLYEVELDLSQVPIFEPVSLELEFLVPFPVVNGRIDFETYAKTRLPLDPVPSGSPVPPLQPRALPRESDLAPRGHAGPIHDRPPLWFPDRLVRRQPRERRRLRMPLDHGMSAVRSPPKRIDPSILSSSFLEGSPGAVGHPDRRPINRGGSMRDGTHR